MIGLFFNRVEIEFMDVEGRKRGDYQLVVDTSEGRGGDYR